MSHWTEVPIPERNYMGILGQINHQVRAFDDKSESKTIDFDKGSIDKLKSNE